MERSQYLWSKVKAVVHTKGFIKYLQDQNNLTHKSTLSGISAKRQRLLKNIYSENEDGTNTQWKCFIKYDSQLRLFWEFIMTIIFTLTFWIIPLTLATHLKNQESIRQFELAMDIFILLDFTSHFFTEKLTDVNLITTIQEASISYIKGFFIIDLLSFLPSLVTKETVEDVYFFKLFRYLRIQRVFMFIQFFEKFLLNFKMFQERKQFIHKFIKFLRLIFLYFLIFHIFACSWFYLAYQPENIGIGDIWYADKEGNYHKEKSENQIFKDGWGYYLWVEINIDEYSRIYLRALYFILSTFSTNGYGDISAMNRNEESLSLAIIFLGQLLFSYVLERVRRLLLSHQDKDLQTLKDNLLENGELMLIQLSKVRGSRPLKSRDIFICTQYLNESFKYNYKNILKDKFYQNLLPKLRNKLAIELFRHSYLKFIHFFKDFESQYNASDQFIAGCLENFELGIFPQNHEIVRRGDKLESIYFIRLGTVEIYDIADNFLVTYISGGFFGEFQAILNLKTQFSYRTSSDNPLYTFNLKTKTFLELLSNDYDAFAYITKLGLMRRKSLRQQSKELIQMNQLNFEDSPQSFRSKFKQVFKRKIQIKVSHLLQIKCKIGGNSLVQNILDDIYAKENLDHENRTKLQHDSPNVKSEWSSDQEGFAFESNKHKIADNLKNLESDDQISDDEIYDQTLPKNYKYYMNQMQKSDDLLKDLQLINQMSRKSFKTLKDNINSLEKYSLEKARYDKPLQDLELSKFASTSNDVLNQQRKIVRKMFYTRKKLNKDSKSRESYDSILLSGNSLFKDEITKLNTKLNMQVGQNQINQEILQQHNISSSSILDQELIYKDFIQNNATKEDGSLIYEQQEQQQSSFMDKADIIELDRSQLSAFIEESSSSSHNSQTEQQNNQQSPTLLKMESMNSSPQNNYSNFLMGNQDFMIAPLTSKAFSKTQTLGFNNQISRLSQNTDEKKQEIYPQNSEQSASPFKFRKQI
eukprot:403377369